MPILYGAPSMSAKIATYALRLRRRVEKQILEVLQKTDYHYLGIKKKLWDPTRIWVYGDGGAVSVNSKSEGILKELYDLCQDWCETQPGENYFNLTVFRELKYFLTKDSSYDFYTEGRYEFCHCGEQSIVWMTTYHRKNGSQPYTYFCMKHALEFYNENKPKSKK